MRDFPERLFSGPPNSSANEANVGPSSENIHATTASHAPQTDTAFKRGDVIGGVYLIHRLLGRGGFGEVYLAYDQQARAACAVKTIRPELLADTASREAFKKEALLWVNLEEHPFILAARLVREFSRRLYVGMDYIAADAQGRVSLADHLKRTNGPMDEGDCLRWAIQFCHGMEHALSHGIKCHRDIKPANVLIARDGTLKVSDFGLAQAAQSALKNQQNYVVTGEPGGGFGLSMAELDGNRICGTPGYIPPEVLLGGDADARGDVYSFGLVLWQMATGSPTPPFHVPYKDAANIEQYLHKVLELQLKGRAPAARGQIRPVVERCLAPEPSLRYASFGDLRKELELIYRQRTGSAVEPPRVGEPSAASWNNRGLSLDELGKHEEAVACFERALETDPRYLAALTNKGVALDAQGRHAEAISCFDRALHFDPESAIAWVNKGHVLLALRRPKESLTCFSQALRTDPQNATIWLNKGWALLLLARCEEAHTCFAHSTQIDPNYASAWIGRALALGSLGRLEEGAECLARAEEIDPQCAVDTKRTLALRGEHKMALGTYKPEAAAWNNKGTAFAEAGRNEEALACFTRAVQVDQEYGAAWYNRAGAFAFLGLHADAIACYDHALQIDTLYADAWDRKGLSLAMLGQYEHAADSWKRCLELAPDNVAAWANRGKALDALGRYEEAAACFTKALEIDPSLTTAQEGKARALRFTLSPSERQGSHG